MTALGAAAVGPHSVESSSRPGLQSFEGYAITCVLAALEMAGLLEALEGAGLRPPPRGEGGGEAGRLLEASLRYLVQRQLAFEDSGAFKLTESGRALTRDKGYLVWLAGGYGEPLRRLDAFLLGRKSYARDYPRDGRWVAEGAAMLGRRDVAPQAMTLLKGISFETALDLGCGNARFLIAVCQTFGCRGVGIDLSPEACQAASESVGAAGMEERIRIIQGDAFDPAVSSHLGRAQLVITFFLLHELSSRGGSALVDFLSSLRSALPPRAHLLAAEVLPPRSRSGRPERFTPEFSLVHALMGQTLSGETEWRQAFRQGGFLVRDVTRVTMPGGVLLLGQRAA